MEIRMDIALYKAPGCQRCHIVKGDLDAKGITCEAFDFVEDKDVVTSFCRANRASLHRNAEGIEFPMLQDRDGKVIRQGVGPILAWLAAGEGLDSCVYRSDLLHGKVSGLDVSKCPAGLEDKFQEVLRLLAKGGLEVQLQSDGRRADLLEKILREGLVSKMVLSIPGPASVYPDAVGGPAPGPEELKKSIELVRGYKNYLIRLWIAPIAGPDGSRQALSPDQAGEAAKLVAEAAGDKTLPFSIQASSEQVKDMESRDETLLPYRTRVRQYLPRADILKEEAGE